MSQDTPEEALREAQKLLELACAAKQLCEWTRGHEYPEKLTPEFVELTSLIDVLDTEVRRVFPAKR